MTRTRAYDSRRAMRVLAFVLVAATAAASCSTAAPPPTTPTEKESSTLKRLAHDDLFEGSVLVARNGRLLLEGGFGMADRGLLTPNGPTTRFRIGSVSKQFTAMAILMLEKQGRLRVSDPLCAHLSGCPQLWSQVTIEELLNHSAGIENYPDDQPDLFDRVRQPITPVEQVAQAGERPLVHPPGTAWSYCNVCYAALGLVVEKEAGTTLTHFLKASVFDPLGMHDTGIDEGYRLPQHAVGYTRQAAVGPAAQLDLTWAFGAGQMYSTVRDLYRWDLALYGDRLLGGNVLSRLMAGAVATGQGNVRYANGWRFDSTHGHPRMWHGGAIPGFTSMIARFPDDRAVVIVLTNLDGQVQQVWPHLEDVALPAR